MATTPLGTVLNNLRRSFLRQDGTGPTDGELLECFITRRDEAAFEALLHRHGPMVLGVCRRVLRNEADAEDAFQATFLVLVRKAASIQSREMVGNWLYGVAHTTALKARAMSTKRLAREREAAARPKREADGETWEQLQGLLDQELKVLPDRYRGAIVLCDLEGKSIQEAARQLGCPPGTVGTRLARGRKLLARRLSRHGLALSGGMIATATTQHATAVVVPPLLMNSTFEAATQVAAGQAASGLVRAKVAILMEGVLKAMLLTRLEITTGVLLAVASVAVGLGALAHPASAQKEDRPAITKPAGPQPAITKPAGPQPALPTYEAGLTLSGHTDPVSSVALTPDGKTLASGSNDETVKLWDVVTGKERDTLKGHDKPVFAVAFTPDGKTLASGSLDYTIKLWDVSTRKELRTLKGHTYPVVALAFTRDGKTLASGSWDKTVKLWEVATGLEGGTFEGHTEPVSAVTFTPDGKTLVSAGYDETIRVWDVTTAKELRMLRGHVHEVRALALSPDGKTLASGGGKGEGQLKLWDLAIGKERVKLKGHAEPVTSLVFTPDGRMLISGSRDGTLRLWDVATGKERDTLKSHTQPVSAVALTSDGRTLVSGGMDNNVQLWSRRLGDKPDK
jgi:RNA polymerase sigma factor (sigma-70 family)